MADKTQIICITCPMGCRLDVTHEGNTVVAVQGNACKRGLEYAQSELADPRRMVTTTVRVQGARHPLLPVYTSAPIPKALVFDLLKTLRKVDLGAPVAAGQIVLADAVGSGADVLASTDAPSFDWELESRR
jgi:CxxC motif-containing protein